MWPRHIKEEALVACGRRCCICHIFCGTKIELHHIIAENEEGPSTLDNCIPLCFNCHADVGHYNPAHPKGTKFSSTELRGHRDKWFSVMAKLSPTSPSTITRTEIYEGETTEICGFVWREAFPGRPNYESLDTDEREVHWILALKSPITLVASSPENDSSFKIEGIQRLQLVLNEQQYSENRHLVLSDARVHGKLWQLHTGHHHGDALFEVSEIHPAEKESGADSFYPKI